MKLRLPALVSIDKRLNGNIIKQLISPDFFLDGEIEDYKKQPSKGYFVIPNDLTSPILVMTDGAQLPEEFEYALRVRLININKREALTDISFGKWVQHPNLNKVPKEPIDFTRQLRKV